MRARDAQEKRCFACGDETNPMLQSDFLQVEVGPRGLSEQLPQISRPSSTARTTPQKPTEAPAAPLHLFGRGRSGLVVIRISECQVAICFSEPAHSVATAG